MNTRLSAEYLGMERYLKAQPPTFDPIDCPCGRSRDKWRCWSRVRRHMLFKQE